MPDENMRHLHPNMRKVWLVRGLIITIVLTAIAGGVAAIIRAATDGGGWLWLPGVFLVVGLVLSVLWPRLSWQRWLWGVSDLALTLRHGVITRHVRALPFFRIQHIDTNQGPVDRMLGLTALVVHTASISSRLPGIASDDAEQLRADLLRRAAIAAREANMDSDVDAV